MVDLSICITTYNLEKYIEKTLESVFNQQTKYTYEVLVGDDGSTDKTIDIVKKWQKKYPDIIKYFVMDRDQNKKYNHIIRASSNRYNLLKNATGKYITFLDGDDFYIDENKIEKQISILENNPDCNICAHNTNFYYEKTGETLPIGKSKFYKKEKKVSFIKYWKNGYYVHAEACIIRNNFDITKENEIFYKKYFDDNFIIYMALKNSKCYYIPDFMINYRQNENGYYKWDEIKRTLLNLMDLDMEIKFNSQNKEASLIRHYLEIKKVYNSKLSNLKEDYKEIYDRAKEDGAEYLIRLFEGNFSKREFLKLTMLYYYNKIMKKIVEIFVR